MGHPAGVLIGERMQRAISQIQVADIKADPPSRIDKLKERRERKNLQRKQLSVKDASSAQLM